MNLGSIDLNLLVTLDALLRDRQVTRAAQRMGLSQPAVSERLGRLRDLLQDELLVRVGQRYELTPFAEELQQPLSECLDRIQALVERKRHFNPLQAELCFTLAATDYVSALLMPPLLERLSREAPNVAVRFTQTLDTSTEQLAHGALDGVIMLSQFPSTLPRRPMFADRWVCVVWKGNPDVGDTLSEEEYSRLPHLVTYIKPEPDSYSFGDEEVQRLEVPRRVVGGTSSFLAAPFMLRGTRMVALLQEKLARAFERSAEIKVLEPPHALPPLEHSLLWNPRHETEPAHSWFRSLLLDVGRAL